MVSWEKALPHGGRELRRIWDHAASSEFIGPTEDAVALAFAAEYAGRAVFDHTAQMWAIWKDGSWHLDARRGIFHECREFTRQAASRLSEPPAGMAKIGFAAAVERGALADPRIAVSFEIWNQDPWLLGVPGGVVDLRSGNVRDARPDNYISRCTSVAPAPAGTAAPLWEGVSAHRYRG